jgi:hypothetical protein
MAAFVILFSAYQGWGQATAPLLVSRLRVAIVVAGGWMLLQHAPRLEWLYCLMAGSNGYWSVNTGHRFRAPAAKSTRFDAFRLKSWPALITEGLHPLQPVSGV